MKKLLSLLMGVALLGAVQTLWADGMGKKEEVSTPVAGSTPIVKHKAKAMGAEHKKSKTSKKKEVKSTWVCPMGDYSGPKTADGKCPKCGMDLVEKK